MLEKLKVGIMRQINILKNNPKAIYPTKVYPIADTAPLPIDDYPVLRFSYDGLLPLYIEDDSYKQMISDYYFHATTSSYDFDQMENIFDKVFIVYCQYFEDHKLRDLDNRNKKYIQDAIRHTKIIKDDTWEIVSNVDLGFIDDINHVDVFVVNAENATNFIEKLRTNIEVYKCPKPQIS